MCREEHPRTWSFHLNLVGSWGRLGQPGSNRWQNYLEHQTRIQSKAHRWGQVPQPERVRMGHDLLPLARS